MSIKLCNADLVSAIPTTSLVSKKLDMVFSKNLTPNSDHTHCKCLKCTKYIEAKSFTFCIYTHVHTYICALYTCNMLVAVGIESMNFMVGCCNKQKAT